MRMQHMALAALILLAWLPLSFAATDCEKSCCRTYSGSWDDTFDDCLHPNAGFDKCNTDCEAAVYAARPQGPAPASPENTYTCKMGFVLASVLAGAFVMGRK